MKATDAHFELSFSPNMDLVNVVRRFAESFYERLLDDASLTARITLTTHELLENAIKYAVDGQSWLRTDVRSDGETFTIEVVTRNRSDRRFAAELKARFEEMEAIKDPSAFYLSLMRRSTAQSDASGLGLGRILAESEMTLTCELKDDEVLIRARASGMCQPITSNNGVIKNEGA